MVRIKEIAQLTGVSAATVSNVLNGKPGAASEVKAREIIEIARNLNYTPNTLAKNLKLKGTKTIGILTEDLTVHNNPEVIDGIDAYCVERGYEIILANMRLYKLFRHEYYSNYDLYGDILTGTMRNMMAKQVEGIVYIANHCREIPALPPWVNVPVVFAHCISQGDMYPAVLYDDEGAACEITALLIDRGHKRIGVIGGFEDSYHTRKRLEGYKKALKAGTIDYDPALVLYGDWYRTSAYHLTEELLKAGVTAIFAFNDIMALGASEKVEEKGLSIGKHIALAGFDNREFSRGITRGITTVETPLNGIGRKCAELVIQQLDKRRGGKKRILLPCKIHVRTSVAAVAGGPASPVPVPSI
ncbi:MAG: LacI family transcriptional regulator [Treponema sp.]|jgi:LacI family transcriptional regulator|nr:LacI family transcriptional regulator [Treponema sp.]